MHRTDPWLLTEADREERRLEREAAGGDPAARQALARRRRLSGAKLEPWREAARDYLDVLGEVERSLPKVLRFLRDSGEALLDVDEDPEPADVVNLQLRINAVNSLLPLSNTGKLRPLRRKLQAAHAALAEIAEP